MLIGDEKTQTRDIIPADTMATINDKCNEKTLVGALVMIVSKSPVSSQIYRAKLIQAQSDSCPWEPGDYLNLYEYKFTICDPESNKAAVRLLRSWAK